MRTNKMTERKSTITQQNTTSPTMMESWSTLPLKMLVLTKFFWQTQLGDSHPSYTGKVYSQPKVGSKRSRFTFPSGNSTQRGWVFLCGTLDGFPSWDWTEDPSTRLGTSTLFSNTFHGSSFTSWKLTTTQMEILNLDMATLKLTKKLLWDTFLIFSNEKAKIR